MTTMQYITDAYTALQDRVEEFAAALDDNNEIFVMLAGFKHFRVFNIEYQWPNLIVFRGESHGSPCEVI